MLKPLFAALLASALILPASAHSGPDHDTPQTSEGASDGQSSDANTSGRTFPGKGKQPHAPVEAYKPGEMLGWKLLIHEDLLADKELHEKVMDELRHQLYLVKASLPEDKVKLLLDVPIWIELQNPYKRGGAEYHPNKQWLADHGYLPEKAKAVEINSAESFVRRWPHHKANVMLHEFAHAYHDLHLGFGHEGIIDAFDKAKASGVYDNVQHIGGRKLRAYALTDHKEYFAEATEAFFGANDHFPFVRPELKEVDKAGYDIVREVWGVKR